MDRICGGDPHDKGSIPFMSAASGLGNLIFFIRKLYGGFDSHTCYFKKVKKGNLSFLRLLFF